MQVELKDSDTEAVAARASYSSAALLFTIPLTAKPEAQATFRHLGTTGYWYIKFERTTGPTTTVYSKKLGPGDAWTERNPPKGDVWALQSGADGDLEYYGSWKS